MRLRLGLALCLPLAAPALARSSGNVLLIVADDVGVHELASYGTGTDPARTPTIDALAANGVRFGRCWSNPLCSPTRATVMTGRPSARTGIGTVVSTGWSLQPSEVTVAELLHAAPTPYTNAFFGKWHLSTEADGALAPNDQGFDRAVWRRANLSAEMSYFRWDEIEDGVEHENVEGYLTSHLIDHAVQFIATAPEPWFVQVSFQSAHNPWHTPPAGLFSSDVSQASVSYQRPLYKAMVEAMDTELGRLLQRVEQMGKTADVIFLGDNGSPSPVIGPPGQAGKAKATLFEGGIHVPLIVAGPSVAAPGATCNALVQTTDVFATILELAGDPVAPELADELQLDSRSIVPFLSEPDAPPLREVALAEYFMPTGFDPTKYWLAARGDRFKLIVTLPDLGVSLFNLSTDPTESLNLLAAPLGPAARIAYADLLQALVGHALTFGT